VSTDYDTSDRLYFEPLTLEDVLAIVEREKPEGNDRGTMWRFNNYCPFEARDRDIYMQCESISLSRGIPFLVRAFVGPFVNGLPRDKLTFNFESTRRYLTQ